MADIIKDIQKHWKAELLFPVNPPLGNDAIVRQMWVSVEIHKMLCGPWENEKREKEWRETSAKMAHIVSGGVISVGNKKDCQMAPMTKPPHWDVWDIRSTKRILGSFIKKDFFIGLVWDERINLGKSNSGEWADLIIKCKEEWKKLFPNYKALNKDGEYEKYLSGITLFK